MLHKLPINRTYALSTMSFSSGQRSETEEFEELTWTSEPVERPDTAKARVAEETFVARVSRCRHVLTANAERRLPTAVHVAQQPRAQTTTTCHPSRLTRKPRHRKRGPTAVCRPAENFGTARQ
jgi:hypothetical protein